MNTYQKIKNRFESFLQEPLNLLYLVVVVAITRFLTLPLYPLMDTTEARYAEIARIMLELNDWVTPWFDDGIPFWGKPPLSFWLTAGSFKVFGINEFGARIPHWLSGIAVIWLIWSLPRSHSLNLAIYTMALLAGSLLFFVSAGAVMTDMVMLVGIAMVMRGFWFGLYQARNNKNFDKWWLFLGLAVGLLAKGPIALVLSLLPIGIWSVVTRNVGNLWRAFPWIYGAIITFILVLPWYVMAEIHTPGFIEYFIIGEHWNRFLVPGWKGDLYGSAHDFPRGTIWLFLLMGTIPWSILLPIFYIVRKLKSPDAIRFSQNKEWLLYLLICSLFPATFFTFAGNILWTYLLPSFPALAILSASWLDSNFPTKIVNRLLAIGLVGTLIVFITFITHLKVSGQEEISSQKELVLEYLQRKQANEPLIYLAKRKFSADFYSSGQVIFTKHLNQIVDNNEIDTAYLAISREKKSELLENCAIELKHINDYGRYSLFHINNFNHSKQNMKNLKEYDRQ